MDRVTDAQLQIDGAACARSRLLLASCDSCQRICPVDAIDLANRNPAVNQQACTLCGACSAVCLEGVFLMPTPLPVVQTETQFILCHCHPQAENGAQEIPCIHSIGLRDLAGMWLQGVRRLVVATGGCPACEVAPMVWIENTVADFNLLAASRNLPEIELATADKEALQDWQNAQDRTAARDGSRRAFLRRFVAPTEPEAANAPDNPLQVFLEKSNKPEPAKTLFPFSPHIDQTRCTGCDDCVNICPHEALTLIKAKNAKSLYHCIPENCTGCQLCSDICDIQAIEVRAMQPIGRDMLLSQFNCRACGASSHASPANPSTGGLCRICQHTDHHKKLFVVLD